MADLDVQPKKGKILPWLLLLIAGAALVYFLMRGSHREIPSASMPEQADTLAKTAPAADWSLINFEVPVTPFNEISDPEVITRGTEAYGIYSLGENILFNEGQSVLRKDAWPKLEQIASSIQQRFPGGAIRVYGYTDATGSAGYNKELAERRAKSVSDWLRESGRVEQDEISLEPIGEARPVATNATGAGRQQNRRVEIVARK